MARENSTIQYSVVIYVLLTCFGNAMILDTSPDEKADILYFGFVFDEQTASSMKNITDNYFSASYSSLPEFEYFLKNVSNLANVTIPNEYYTKPLDPNSEEYDPLYHVTAKYCGDNQQICSEYETNNSKYIDTKFEMQLVGYVLTSRTFGIRVDLTIQQRQLFDEEDGKAIESIAQNSIASSTLFPMSLPGELKLEEQDFPPQLPVTATKAHVTLGCAPGVPAVITGPDMLQVLSYENNVTFWNTSWDALTDPMDPDARNMRITLFKPNASSPPSDYLFVIYPRVKVVANATLLPYYQNPSFGEHYAQ